ncbi:uncharacterized protein LTR77_007222 [Saxophila tyrrhenica]|uniref:Uncharacterized protein n=1 Tax=Saxophila tyrrhenica TaxID=1690608 RepID=A0AAV9P4U7_9PEZI|nr:hypothetical protein LTR77_007222 [Saxophila tyrrhenica]
MALHVASPTPLSTASLFDDDWKNCGGDIGDLGAIAAFNDTFYAHRFGSSNQTGPGSEIDPQLLSSAPSPASTHTAFDSYSHDHQNVGSLDTSMFGFYAPSNSSHGAVPAASPYLQQTWGPFGPPHQQRSFQTSPHLHPQLHRRSISEPPEQHHMPWPPQPQPVPTFTRSGTPLGIPRQMNGQINRASSKRQPPYRQHFSVAKRQAPRQERYQLRRTQTQPIRGPGGPTSVPPSHVHQSPPVPQMMMSQPALMPPPPPPPPQAQMVSSRVCTPGPPPAHGLNEDNTNGHASPSPTSGPAQRQIGVQIPLTLDELKAMIKGAVQEAVKASLAELSRGTASAPVDETAASEETAGSEVPSATDEDKDDDTIQVCYGMEGVRNSIEVDDGLF